MGIHASDGSACCSMAHGKISRTCVMCFLHANPEFETNNENEALWTHSSVCCCHGQRRAQSAWDTAKCPTAPVAHNSCFT